MIEFLYPGDWQNFITDSSNCGEVTPNRFENGITEIVFPQPSLSAKIAPRIIISVEPCCEFITSRDAGGYSAEMRNMSVVEYVSQELDRLTGQGTRIINSGPITLDGNPAAKIVIGPDLLTPVGVYVYSSSKFDVSHFIV